MTSAPIININEAPQLTMHVSIRGFRVWRWRVAVASWLVRVADRVAPVNVSIDQKVV